MSTIPTTSATRPVDPKTVELLRSLKPGDRLKITQRVRVGRQQWTTTVFGTFRDANYLRTGLATDRVKEDDIVVVSVHFTKDNGELSSITLDEHTLLERTGGA